MIALIIWKFQIVNNLCSFEFCKNEFIEGECSAIPAFAGVVDDGLFQFYINWIFRNPDVPAGKAEGFGAGAGVNDLDGWHVAAR